MIALRRRRPPAAVDITAWELVEGDVLPDGVGTVLLLSREATTRTVRLTTSAGVAAELPGDSPVVVLRR